MPSILNYIESTAPSPTTVYINGSMSPVEGELFEGAKTQPATAAAAPARRPLRSQFPAPVGSPEALAGLADHAAATSNRRPSLTRSSARSPSRYSSSSAHDGDSNHNNSNNSSLPRRQHLAVEVPDVPAIPAHFLKTGRPASIASPLSPPSPALAGRPSPALLKTSSSYPRPTTSSGEHSARTASRSPLRRSSSLNGRRKNDRIAAAAAVETTPPRKATAPLHEQPGFTRNISLPATPATVDVHRADALSMLESRTPSGEALWKMARPGSRGNHQDYFLLAADENDNMIDRDSLRQLRRSESRASQAGKRRSLPADALADSSNRRPNTSGNIYTTRPSSRLTPNNGPTDLQRHIDHYRGAPHRASIQFGDSASVSGLSASGATRRFSVIPDRSPISPSRFRERLASPELPQYGRRRPSFSSTVSNTHQRDIAQPPSRTFDLQEESPTESSDPKQTDSTSNESQTADTVWDELDDLKSRIKKLELTGKMPTTSSAAVSGELSDRPRTATTAPTTVDSSPKQERKRIAQEKAASTPQSLEQDPVQSAAGTTPTDVHPTLHAALAKAKPLLNASVFSILEATATDALQLAAMTGSAGPQGTTFSAASIINGATASDRHVRRKADTMCRNLTDLCLMLCEGKYERPNVVTRQEVMSSPSLVTSPQSEDTFTQDSPSLRHAGSDISRRASASRPMSRLEARRSSILGLQTSHSFESVSPRGSVGDISASEQDTAQMQSFPSQHPQQRVSRAPSSLRGRVQRFEDAGGEDDPTIRPSSRAMTDIGALRVRTRNIGEDRSPISQRTPSLRESLAARRNNEAAFENNRETPRMTSDSRRRRLLDQQSTPPVLEENISPAEFYPSSQPQRRMTSGQFSSRRTTAEFGRSPSLRQQRHVIVE